MKLTDIFKKIKALFGGNHSKSDYSVKNMDIPFSDMPQVAFGIIRKYGLFVFFYKLLNYLRISFKKKIVLRISRIDFHRNFIYLGDEISFAYKKGGLYGVMKGAYNYILRKRLGGRHHSKRIFIKNRIIEKDSYKKNEWPSFSVVGILYNKEKEILFFLKSFFNQSYAGKIEIILVDDTSTDNAIPVVENFVQEMKQKGIVNPKVTIIRNEKNIGNCGSRNKAIASSSGDIVLIIDADCVVNKDFLKRHAEAYYPGDCDVAIGPFNLETNGRDPESVVAHYQDRLEEAEADALFQDKINKRSFLNCITRNFSVRRSFIKEDLFDEIFSYSRNPESGFGWEDIEMGYRLYKRGARIKYLPNAFSIHVSHSPTSAKDIPLRSLKNFRRLFEKHPELLFVARRWALDTYGKICAWVKNSDLPKTEDWEYLDHYFQRFLHEPFYTSENKEKRLRILSYRWHCSHQYEIYKLPHDFTLVTGLGSGITESWEYERRPLPDNVVMEHNKNIRVKDYDLAILHFDENVLAPENTNGIIGQDWGASFKWFHKNVNLPKVAICHGTPQFYGQYKGDYHGHKLMEIIEKERQRLVDYLGDTLVIVNSYQAQREWGFRRSKVIWHGFDPTEFFQGTHEKNNVLIMGEKAMTHRPHYNGYVVAKEVFEQMPKECFSHLSTPAPSTFHDPETNEYAYEKFSNYVRELGKYSIYFNATLRSPMPRTRAEAMMCGVVLVTTKNHDVELFIKNGVNGFYSDSPDKLRTYLTYLLEHPDKAREIGNAGRQTALDIFNHDRFLKAWEENIEEILK